ncbi:hypothetical protein [Pendulispora albinea]|uniref:PIN domain-containing protein n=1 Tax=Pendulispora albinea TaxID=2741071 RepID=A0ABZ2LIU1_9BACT
MIPCFVLDTGALIEAERPGPRMRGFLSMVHHGRAAAVTPTSCVLEWWRKRTDRCEKVLALVNVEPLTLAAAQAAGVALGKMKERVDSKLSIDASVLATASLLGAMVLTGDFDDLSRVATHFPGVRVLSSRSEGGSSAR